MMGTSKDTSSLLVLARSLKESLKSLGILAVESIRD